MKKKILAIAMAFALSILCIPSAKADETVTLGSVTDVTGTKGDVIDKDSYTAATFSGTNADATLTFDALGLKVLGAGSEGASADRPAGYAWVGIKVEEPTGVSGGSWTAKYSYNGGVEKEFTKAEDGWFLWPAVKEESLKNAIEGNSNVVLTYKINWVNGEKKATQNIKLVIAPNKVTIVDDRDGEETTVWSPEIAKEVKAAASNKTATTEAKKDDVPKTGDSLPLALVGIVSVMMGAAFYTVKAIKE